MHQRQYRPGEVIVARAQRARFPHPLRGTEIARRYRRTMRFVGATLLARRHNAGLPPDAPTLQFHPVRPSPKSSIVRLCARLGLRIGFDPQGPGTAFAWDDGHLFPAAAVRRLPPDAINGSCLDISKSHVDAAWQQVAGYGLALDPTTTAEPIVVKSEENGNHDGQLIMGPLARREPGLVYQRLVESVADDGQVYATRPVVLGTSVPMAFEVRRETPAWFHGGVTVGPVDPTTLYSPAEIDLLVRFCALIGMEYGEIDVLRDRTDGRIYVVDANRTPLRPLTMPPECDEAVYSLMSAAFAEFLAKRGVPLATAE
jgi:hypothetical protein